MVEPAQKFRCGDPDGKMLRVGLTARTSFRPIVREFASVVMRISLVFEAIGREWPFPAGVKLSTPSVQGPEIKKPPERRLPR
jgi:hypothetical protein